MWYCTIVVQKSKLIYQLNVEIGCETNVGELVYEAPRDGPTLWEIGIPDRSAAEFYVPDPNPKYINKLYVNHPDKLVTFLCLLYTFKL